MSVAGSVTAPRGHSAEQPSPWTAAELSSRNCPLCSSGSGAPAGRRTDGLAFSRCPACGLVYADPAPPIEAAVRLYRQDYFGVVRNAAPVCQGYENYLEHQNRAHDPRRIEVRLIERYEPDLRGKRALDVGCGSGVLLSCLAERGCVVAGVELNPAVAARARSRLGVSVYESPFEKPLPLQDKSFDVVTACSVLEHSADPRAFLDEAARLAAPGALLLIVTPRWEASHRAGADWIGWNGQWDHLCYFSSESLDRALTRRGFRRLVVGAGGPPARLSQVRRKRASKALRSRIRRAPVLGPALVELKRRLFPPELAALDSEHADLIALYRRAA